MNKAVSYVERIGRVPPPWHRTALAFLLSPTISGIPLVGWEAWIEGVNNPGSMMVGGIAIVLGYAAEVIFGFPLYLVLRRFGRAGNLKVYIFVGAFSGLLVGSIAFVVGAILGLLIGMLAGLTFWLIENYSWRTADV